MFATEGSTRICTLAPREFGTFGCVACLRNKTAERIDKGAKMEAGVSRLLKIRENIINMIASYLWVLSMCVDSGFV